jgi:hypothetical protein
MIVSSIIMTAGCGSLAVADRDNLHMLWGLLVLAGLGIGGIVVPASIISELVSHLVSVLELISRSQLPSSALTT